MPYDTFACFADLIIIIIIIMTEGKVISNEGIQLPDGINTKDIDETGYRFLGIIEGEE